MNNGNMVSYLELLSLDVLREKHPNPVLFFPYSLGRGRHALKTPPYYHPSVEYLVDVSELLGKVFHEASPLHSSFYSLHLFALVVKYSIIMLLRGMDEAEKLSCFNWWQTF